MLFAAHRRRFKRFSCKIGVGIGELHFSKQLKKLSVLGVLELVKTSLSFNLSIKMC